MKEEQRIWYGLQAGLVVFWLIVPLVGLMGFHLPWLTMLAAIILLAHVLEIPLAMNKLRPLQLPSGKVILKTLVFGFTWWLPLSKGYTRE
ncbi:MAG TPA: hypothetical protein VFV43_04310 [Limnobacter sp.]|nr:hypothetical protein [Limnobacter sp.]